MDKKNLAISLILYKYFYREVDEAEIEAELPGLLELSQAELEAYRDILVEEKAAILAYFSRPLDIKTIKQGLVEVGVAYIDRADFTVVDYQDMIVHYLFNMFFPGHDIELRFDTPTTGSLTIDGEIINFGV